MSDLTAKFTALEEQLASQATTMGGYVDTVEAKLQAVLDNLDTVINNNSANAQAILAALGANSACSPCPVPPLLGVPVIPDTQPINADKCKRVQALLHTIGEFCDFADATGTVSSAFTPGFITGIIDEVRTANSDSGIPVPGWLDTVQIAADGVNFVINRVLFGGGCHATLDPLLVDLQSSLFAAGSPSDAKSSYNAAIDGSSGLAASKPLLKGMGFSDLFNYYLDPGTAPNLSGFDGTVCGLPPGCLTFTTSDMFVAETEGGTKYVPNWEIYGLHIVNNPGHVNQIWVDGFWRGWSWTITDNSSDVFHTDVHNVQAGIDLTGTWSTSIANEEIITFVSNNPFALSFCPPGE